MEMHVVSIKTFGRRIQTARERMQISQAELARRVGLRDQSNLSRWERGCAEPGILQASKVAIELGLTPNEAVLEGSLPTGSGSQLSVEELEILRLIREMQRKVYDVEVGPLQVVLNMVRNSHRMIMECSMERDRDDERGD